MTRNYDEYPDDKRAPAAGTTDAQCSYAQTAPIVSPQVFFDKPCDACGGIPEYETPICAECEQRLAAAAEQALQDAKDALESALEPIRRYWLKVRGLRGDDEVNFAIGQIDNAIDAVQDEAAR